MQNVELQLDHYNFFCPVTGQQVLSSDDFNPSPAMLFCYLEDESVFEHAQDFITDAYNKCIEEIGGNANENNAFKKLVDEKLNERNNFLMFTLVSRGVACGPVSMVSHIAFDMNYYESEKRLGTNYQI